MQLFWTVQVAIASLGLTALVLERSTLPFRTQQRTIRALLVLCPLVFLVASNIPRGQWEPAERWMPETFAREVASPESPAEKSDGSMTIPAAPWFPWWWLPSGLLLLKFSRDAWLLHRRVASARAVHPYDGLPVRLAPEGSTYAAFTGTGPVIVLDPDTWESEQDRPIALAHEAQHHAHGDPLWAWVFALIPVLGALNPFAYALVRRVRLLDELAVDAVLAPSDPPAYAASILRGARRHVAPRLALAASSAPLDTRIRTMLTPPKHLRLPLAASLLLGTLILTGSAFAFGVRGAPDVHESALVVEHDLVVERTARMADSEWVRNALLQTERIEQVVNALKERGMPVDLAGIPLAESGFQNLGVGPKPIYTAGMWQFIPATAKNYGLQVSESVDERQDVSKATDAALTLLQDLHDEFGDWKLAVVAYNIGAKALRKAIKAENTRDVMVLVEREAVPKYILNVMASTVLLRDAGMLK